MNAQMTVHVSTWLNMNGHLSIQLIILELMDLTLAIGDSTALLHQQFRHCIGRRNRALVQTIA